MQWAEPTTSMNLPIADIDTAPKEVRFRHCSPARPGVFLTIHDQHVILAGRKFIR
jgi:hypothetical protein